MQPYLFAGGMLIFTVSMTFAGSFGVPRRHWDITFASAPPALRFNFLENAEINVFMAMLGIGAIIAVTAGAMFVLSIVLTVFAGARSATPYLGRIAPDTFSPLPAVAGGSIDDPHEADEHGFEVPGTLTLAVAFLALFILLYGVSWYELSSVPWRLFLPDRTG
jgi:cytochrome c oxidase subunit I